MVIAAAGSVDHDAIVELAERTLREREPTAARRRSSRRPPSRRRPSASSARTPSRCHVCLGAVGLPRDDDRRFAARVLDAIFGGLSSSRLFQAVREERGLAYSVYSFAGQYADTGQIGLYVGTRPDNLGEAMAVVGDELERLREHPATEDELERARENVKARVILALESSGARMNRLGGVAAVRAAAARARRADGAHRRRDARRPARADRRAVGAERLSAAGIGPDEEAFRAAVEDVCPGTGVAA